MREEQRKKLDRLLRQQRTRTLLRAAYVVVPALLLVSLFFVWWFDPPVPSVTVMGTVAGLSQTQSYQPGPPFFIVELDTGGRVSVGGTSHLLYEPGREVVLQEYEGKIFGSRSFRFLRYAEE